MLSKKQIELLNIIDEAVNEKGDCYFDIDIDGLTLSEKQDLRYLETSKLITTKLDICSMVVFCEITDRAIPFLSC